jgi:formylglycine-generating enzyme required for sulfatase activity
MVFVEGGTLPYTSEFAGKSVESFWISRTEVTWLECKGVRNWAADTGYDIGNMGEGRGNDHPVQNVNWYDCVKWCNAKSEMAGLKPVYQVKGQVYRNGEYGAEGFKMISRNDSANGYRLPSGAEWEWAARGGVKSRGFKFSGSDELDVIGWHIQNSNARVHPVKEKAPNEIGLHDMSGNLWEWCWESNAAEYQVRGGSGTNYSEHCAVAYIPPNATTPDRSSPFIGLPAIGFRIARSN